MTMPPEPATLAYRDKFEAEIDDMAIRIVAQITPADHASGVLLLCATRLIGHLAGHLDNTRSMKGERRAGAEASMHEAYRLVDVGRPK